jgi:hypothetical protein
MLIRGHETAQRCPNERRFGPFLSVYGNSNLVWTLSSASVPQIKSAADFLSGALW